MSSQKKRRRRFRTQLPPVASRMQKIFYPFLRNAFFFFFTYLPYAPIRRVNKPDLHGPLIWASTHSNFLCDVIPAAFEGPSPTKFLGKSTLFRFPVGNFLSFCGALPLMRAEDHANASKEARALQNRSTFAAAIAALKQGWAVAIYPEGTSIVAPGIVLPLKPGVAKLALAAEEENDFKLGLRIIPVGLEYGSRLRVGSGLVIRYGRPIFVTEFQEKYLEDRDAGVRALMDELTVELIRSFPHFRDEKTQTLGRKLVALGICRYKHEAAQLFLKYEKDKDFWEGLETRMRAFEEASKGHSVPVPAWGYRRAWKELGPARRRSRVALLILGAPMAIVDFVNNTLPEIGLRSVVDFAAVDDTEKMSLRFIFSPVVLSVLYGLQFLFLKKMVFPELMAGAGLLAWIAYSLTSFVIWHIAIHWWRQCKRLGSLFFFKRAKLGAHSDAVMRHRELRQYLGQFQDHGRQ
jgi:1-acyl-sn-glycerol-3-phosphate acyltransferase